MSSGLYDLLGGGGLDATFSDWTSARAFTKRQIRENPRFSDDVKNALLDAEQRAYDTATEDRNVIDYLGNLTDMLPEWLQNQSPLDIYADSRERSQIGLYFDELKRVFPSITGDQKFLAVFNAAVEVSVDTLDEEIIESTKKEFKLPTWFYVGAALWFWNVAKK